LWCSASGCHHHIVNLDRHSLQFQAQTP
jgi:hypothetical protein